MMLIMKAKHVLNVVKNVDDDEKQYHQERHSSRYNLTITFGDRSKSCMHTFGSMIKLIHETVTNNMHGM